jgi:hypothetical protein
MVFRKIVNLILSQSWAFAKRQRPFLFIEYEPNKFGGYDTKIGGRDVKTKLDFEQVKGSFKEAGFVLHEDVYVNADEPMKVSCIYGHEFYIRYNDFRKGIRCPIDGCKKSP